MTATTLAALADLDISAHSFTPAEISSLMREAAHKIIDRFFCTLDDVSSAPRLPGGQAVRMFGERQGSEDFARQLGRHLATRAPLVTDDCTDEPGCACLTCLWVSIDDAMSYCGDRDVQRLLAEAEREREDICRTLAQIVAAGRAGEIPGWKER